MKLVFGSLSDFVAEIKEQRISECRLSVDIKQDICYRCCRINSVYQAVLTAQMVQAVAEYSVKTAEFICTPSRPKVPRSIVTEMKTEELQNMLQKEGITVKNGIWMTEQEATHVQP